MRTPALTALFVFTLFAACGGEAGTAADTEVLDWSRSSLTTMEDVHLGDDVGPARNETKTLVFTPEERGLCGPSFQDVRIELALSYGEVAEHMEGTHQVPRTVSATVVQNDVWQIEGACDEAMRVPLGDVGGGTVEVPEVLRAACQINLRRGADDNRVANLEIAGDGQIEVTAGFDAARIE